LSLHSFCLGVLAKVSIASVDHLAHVLGYHRGPFGSSTDVALGVITTTASRSISWLTARLPTVTKDAMFSMVASNALLSPLWNPLEGSTM
jgi:hypothetical protein